MAFETKKRSHDESAPTGNAAAGPSKAPRFTSALKADEGDFPRGGGTTLSAFELKQVREEGRREAEADIAAEVSSARNSTVPVLIGRLGADRRRSPRGRSATVKPSD
jgi:hypothetical protein